MTKRLISLFLTLVFLIAVPLSAAYRYNPYTRKLDYYEAAGDIVLGDIGDITLTGLANGDLLYYNGTAWVNLTVGVGATVLTVAAGIPSWAAPGAPAAHAATHLAAGADSVDHDLLLNYLAAQHLTLPSTIAAVLTDHTQAAHNALNIDADTVDGEHAAAIVTNARVKAHFPDTIANILSDHNLLAHTALGLFDASADVDHNATTNYAANQHRVWENSIAQNIHIDNIPVAGIDHGTLAGLADKDHMLNGIGNPTGNVLFTMTSRQIKYLYTVPATADGAFEIEITGVFTGDVLHVHQHTGNPGATNLVVFEAEDSDVIPLTVTGIGTYDIITGGLSVTEVANISGNATFTEDVFWTWADAADHAAITQAAVAGIEDQPLILIDDDRTGVTANELFEATIVLEAAGVYALNIASGDVYFQDVVTVHGQAYFDADTNQYEDVFMTWADANDKMVIAQSAVGGTEDVPLIFIDDDRTGVTANEPSEATIYIDAAGTYALNVAAGQSYFQGSVTIADGGSINLQEDITFTGATTENQLKFPDNLEDAFSMLEGANKYITFITTDDEEDIVFNKPLHVFHTAVVADDHALELDVDAANFGDIKAINIDYITGTIAAGQDEGIILVNIDKTLATGGDIFGLEVLATDQVSGTTGVYGMKVGVVIGPVHQDSGTFANPTTGTDNTINTDVAAMIDGNPGTTTAIFEINNEYILIGAASPFEEIEFIITTGASGAGIKPTFWYSITGAHLFTQFTPVDGTNGFKNTGVVAWDASDLTAHAVNTDTSTYDIKIIRTRVTLGTTPILGYAKTAATTEYIWDKDGDVNIRNLTASGDISADSLNSPSATGTMKIFTYQNDALADEASVNLPDAVYGWVHVMGGTQGGWFLIANDATVTSVGATANCVPTDTDGKMCVFDGGANTAVVKNRLGGVAYVRIFMMYE